MQNMLNWVRDCMIVLGVFLLGYLTCHYINPQIKKEVITETSCKDSLTEDCVKLYLDKHKIKFSHIVYAQAVIESNHFKSSLSKRNNNIFGMRVAAQRFTFATNSHDYGNYAKYESIEECILDYKAWQIQNAFFTTTEAQYYDLLSKHYAEDPNYINALKKIIK